MKNEKLENARIKYQTAINIFNSEGQIQWGRYNAMLVVNSLLLTLTGILSKNDFQIPVLIVEIAPIVGLVFCYLWFKMTKNGFYWINHWISEARKLEDQLPDKKNIYPIISGDKKES